MRQVMCAFPEDLVRFSAELTVQGAPAFRRSVGLET